MLSASRRRPAATSRLVVATSLLTCVGTGCTADEQTEEERDAAVYAACVAREADELRVLEPAVDDLLAGKRHRDVRFSTCEEAGEPRAVVYATVPTWQRRAQASDFLRRLGWRHPPGPSLITSPDGTLQANIVLNHDGLKHDGPVVEVHVSLAP